MINPTQNNRLFNIIDMIDRQYRKPRVGYNILIKDSFDNFYQKSKEIVERKDYNDIRAKLVDFPEDKDSYDKLRKRIKKLIIPVTKKLKKQQALLKA